MSFVAMARGAPTLARLADVERAWATWQATEGRGCSGPAVQRMREALDETLDALIAEEST
jgi:hypothetical protein